MPYIDDGKESTHYTKISKKKEEELKKKGFKPYDVRFSIKASRGGKVKVWAKNKDDAAGSGKTALLNAMEVRDGEGLGVKDWKKPKHPKTRVKRKNNPRFKPKKITKIHPKTGKKYTQIIYKHSKDWNKYPRTGYKNKY